MGTINGETCQTCQYWKVWYYDNPPHLGYCTTGHHKGRVMGADEHICYAEDIRRRIQAENEAKYGQ